MTATQYWHFYRVRYYAMVGIFAQAHVEVRGENVTLDEGTFERANELAAKDAQQELEFRSWEARFIGNPNRKPLYGEVSA